MQEPPMFIVRRDNGVLYFRRPIPKKLQPFLNSGNRLEFTFSLKSKKLTAEARQRHHEFLMESARLLEEAEARAKAGTVQAVKGKAPQTDSVRRRPLQDFTEAELRLLVARWMSGEQERAVERCRTLAAFGNEEDRRQEKEAAEARIADLLNNGREMNRVMREILTAAGGEIPFPLSGSAVMLSATFGGLVREGLLSVGQGVLSYLETGLWPAAAQTPAAPVANGVLQPISNSAPGAPALTLNQLIEQFENDPKRQGITAKTRDEFQIVFRTLREMLGGETPVASIRREQLKEIQAVCLGLPAHYTRHYPGKPMREIPALAKKDGRPPMNPTTFNKRMTLLAGVFAYAVREHVIVSSPALGLTVEAEAAEPGAKSFTTEQLKRIFSGRVFQSFAGGSQARSVPGLEAEPHQFWAPLLGLLQGMREEEILQLGPQDVVEVDGVPCLQIGLRKGQKVKTKQSKRTIPIHPELIRLGFLRFASAAQAGSLPDLFPDASPGKTYGNRSHNYSKRFNRYLREIGVKTSRNQCFHSLRHTFADGLRTAGVSREALRYIGGWTDGTSSLSDGYGGRLHGYLAGELAKLTFEGLDLAFL